MTAAALVAFVRTACAVAVERAPRPLVVELAPYRYAWVEAGIGHRWSVVTGWQPLDGAEGLGGRVLHAGEVAALVAQIGRPT